ncbi:sushi, von Willebrand factor type A, EGF and pentraxin domain-containing protein 1-like isoform X4 [Sardina pilchardus]|uniref:sushi, von Willebrand factor type A, EGF and pentraxin domain-containing protein 1-like isoform X4 n=1 Tax=Sardina pilchardus TaxID=27697 RepID=UPI002E143E3A
MTFFKNILGTLSILLLLPSEIKGQCTKPTTTSDHAGVHSADILKDTFEEGSSIRLQCHPGYERSSGLSRLTCAGGQWTPSPESFICKKKSCGNPGEVNNGDYQFPNGVEFGAEITAVCKTGYYIVGENKRTCMANGQWDGREAICDPVRCGPPPDVTNGLLTLPPNEEYEYGHAVQYKCSDGYTLFGDEDPADTVHCLADATWSKKPRCTKVECPRQSIPNAKRIEGPSGPYGFGARLVYECNVGYRFLPPDNNRMVCSEYGWSHNLTCEVVKCSQPGATNATITEGAADSYQYGAIVKYKCPAGHTLLGSPELRCKSDGQWSSNPPVCLKVVECPEPPATNATITGEPNGPYYSGAIIRYECPDKQTMSGPSQLECRPNGQWSPGPPVCHEGGLTVLKILGAVFGVLFGVGAIVGGFWLYKNNKKKNESYTRPSSSEGEELKSRSANNPENGV